MNFNDIIVAVIESVIPQTTSSPILVFHSQYTFELYIIYLSQGYDHFKLSTY
jgi:hypothetical protein